MKDIEEVHVKLVTEGYNALEASEKDKTETLCDYDILDSDGNIIVDSDSDIGDWEKRHNEIEMQREQIRRRVRRIQSGNGVIRQAKPKPTISDTGEKTVGVYTRVSTTSVNQTSSIENQTKYYTKKVEDTPNWTLHEIYSDEGKSGTSTQHRTEFMRMIEDASQKKIDLILCASVSRFARNMSDCMTLVRQLKSMNPSHPVGVYFETENIYTLDPDCKQNLSIHAMLADWESANKSRRMILSYDQRICTGQYPVVDLLGYRHTKDGNLIIQPDEAITVRYIFLAYIGGYDCEQIAEVLTEHERPTLRGRTEWNASMVRSVMSNERRWGDLEARKTIVIDYVEHKSKKNENDRISAYEENHHEAIVSREIATAAKMVMKSSGKLADGIPELMVISRGNLKGFVSVCPGWGGISSHVLMQVCQEVYETEELQELRKKIRVWSGEENAKVVSMALSGYQVPHGIYFLNNKMPSLTFTIKNMKFNKACLAAFGFCRWIEILYHPIMQTIILRETSEDNPNRVEWIREDGKISGAVLAKAFSASVYKNMQWKQEYSFRFRGITKERGNRKILVFSLDEPRILVDKKNRSNADIEQECGSPFGFVKHKVSDADGENKETGWQSACSEELARRRMGISYFAREQRDRVINVVTESDIAESGRITENPMIGHIPSRAEIVDELEELLMSM